jgi:hypothetical protein
MKLCRDSEATARRLRIDCAATSDCAATMQRQRSDYAATAQRLCSDCAAIIQKLCIYSEATTRRLRSDCHNYIYLAADLSGDIACNHHQHNTILTHPSKSPHNTKIHHSRRNRCAIIAISLRNRFETTSESFRNHCSITAKSLQNR